MPKSILFAHIAPVKHILHAAAQSQVHMALQHLCVRDSDYVKAFKRLSSEKEYIYLDNSQFELGEPCSLSDLIEAGHRIEASCLILPDGDVSDESIHAVKDAGFDVMVIPEGPALDELFVEALNNPKVDVVGLSYSKTSQFLGRHRHSATSRFDFLTSLGTVLPNKRIHLLGAVTPGEIALMKPFEDAILSWDSSLAVWGGLLSYDITKLTHKNPESVDFNSDLPWETMCNTNIAYINKLLN